MDTVVTMDDEEEEEAEQTSTQLHNGVHCSLVTLCDWYNSKVKVRPWSSTRVHDLTYEMWFDHLMVRFPLYSRTPALVLLGKSVILLLEMTHSNLLL